MDISTMAWLVLTMVFVLFMNGYFADPLYRLYCFEVDENGPRARLRFKANGDLSITGLQAYDSTIDPRYAEPVAFENQECITQSPVTSDIYELSILVNQCGSTPKKRIRVLGTNAYYDLDCTINGATISNTVSDSVTVIPSPVPHHHVYPNPFDIKCMVFAASGWNAPVWEAEYGQDLKLRCIYNKGKLGSARDNWGKSFHIAFPTHAAATFIGIEIYTSELGTRVHIVGELPGYRIDEMVFVKRDSAFRKDIIPLQYGATSASETAWLVEPRGIKIVSLDERIGVRVISHSETNQHGSSYTALPDDILGKRYLTADLESPSDEDVELVIIATEDDTDLTVTYNNFNDQTLITVGTTQVNLATHSSTTVKINEGETFSVVCDSDCFQLVLVGSKEVGVVIGLDNNEHAYSGTEGHIMTQLTPVENYGEEFLSVFPSSFGPTYKFRNDDLTLATYTTSESLKFSSPVSMYLHTQGAQLLSLGKDAFQTDTSLGGVPDRAVDGNTATVLSSDSCTHTLTTSGTWWEVDLGQIYTIDKVVIYGRTNYCCPNRLRDVQLLIGDTNVAYIQQAVYSGVLPTPSYTFEMTSIVNGRWVRITRPSTVNEVLTLCEVQVFGYPIGDDDEFQDPVLLSIPAVSQWGINYFFYARYGATYKLVFVGKYLDSISFTTGSVTTDLAGTLLSHQPGYVASTLEYLDGLTEYYTYEVIVQVTDNGYNTREGLIEFQAEEKWKPFQLYIFETRDGHTEAYLPLGVRWTLSPDYCTKTDYIRPDDGIDNDCDGYTGEEIQNGVDDDSDGDDDEDVTSHNNPGATGVYVHRVEVCDGDDSECSVIYDGCYDDRYDNIRGKNPYFKMEPFEHNVNLTEEFDHLWVIDTPAFYAWKPITPANDGEITITVFYRMCFGDLTLCEDSCIEKRSTDGEGQWAVSTRIPFHWNRTHQRGKNDKESGTTNGLTTNPCSGNPVFWIPVSMLLIMILIMSMATVFFLYKRSQFIRRIQYIKTCEVKYQKN